MPGAVLYPHPTLSGDLHLTLHQVLLDDKPLPSNQIQHPYYTADLGRSGQTDWQVARLDWVLKYEPENGADGISEFTAKHGEIRAWLALDCRPTNLRISLKMLPDEIPGIWKGTLIVDRDNVSGTAKVEASLACDFENDRIEMKHRVAAESYPWTIFLDPPRSFQREGGLQMHWIDFAKTEEIEWLKDYSAAFSAVDMSNEVPRILLNNSISGFQELLTTDKKDDAIHETLKTMAATNVARGAWMALAHQSIQSLNRDGGNLKDWSGHGWEREVLQTLALILGPNQRLADWIENDGADWIRDGLTPANWTKLDVALGDWLAKRSNLATNWNKWTKLETVAKSDTTENESKPGFIKRMKNRLTLNKDQPETIKSEVGDDE